MPDVEPQIGVERSTLGGALRNGPLSIPNFQREYSWQAARVRKLFDDFNNAMVKRQSSYFLGTVVMTPGLPVQDVEHTLCLPEGFLSSQFEEHDPTEPHIAKFNRRSVQ